MKDLVSNMPTVVLASSSSRRISLLKEILDDFIVQSSDKEEIYPSSLNPLEVPLYLSNLKAYDIYKDNKDKLVIGADTAIIFNNKVIGKPKDKNDAREMLLSFSNNMHYVVTGVTVYYKDMKYQINSINEVYFKRVSENEIDDYLEHDEYRDKAGSYAIQGLANKFIDKYIGEYESVVGLPIKELKELLNKIIK